MNQEFTTESFERLVSEKNYLAAYMLLKGITVPRAMYLELTGKLVSKVLDEFPASSGNREKIRVYRSLLLYIFEDIPGLGKIYQRQLRLAEGGGNSFDLLQNIRKLIDVSKDKDELKAHIENTIEDIKDKIDETAETIKDGSAQEKVQDFFTLAGEGIKEGIKNISDFFQKVVETGRQKNDKEEDGNTIKQAAEPVEETDVHRNDEKTKTDDNKKS